MKPSAMFFIMSALAFAFCAAAPGFAAFTGEVSVGSVTAGPGQQAVVPVYLTNNNIGIMAMNIPLKYSSSDLQVDSVSFVGTLLGLNMNGLSQINNASRFVQFTYAPKVGTQEITAESGLLARIYFTINAAAQDQTVWVDSVNKVETYGQYELWTRLEVADTTGLQVFLPAFSEGLLTVQSPLAADDDQLNLPAALELRQNYPNPFNPSTIISFTLPARAHVSLKIYNILGQEIATLVEGVENAGIHEIYWDAAGAASGVYFYRLTYNNEVLTRKMALLR